MSDIDPDMLRVPAFQRKRNIDSRAKKKLLMTAFDRKKIEVSVIDEPKKKRTYRRAFRSSSISRISPRTSNISRNLFTPPILDAPDAGIDLGVTRRLRKSSLPAVRKMAVAGRCEGYLERIEVAIIKLESSLRNEDRVLFETFDGLFEQTVASMQIDRVDVKKASPGSDIGIKVSMAPRVGGTVYKVV